MNLPLALFHASLRPGLRLSAPSSDSRNGFVSEAFARAEKKRHSAVRLQSAGGGPGGGVGGGGGGGGVGG